MKKVTGMAYGLTSRELAVLFCGAVIGMFGVVAAVLDLNALASAAPALAVLLVLAVTLQTRRQLNRGLRSLHGQMKALRTDSDRAEERLETAYRRILAAVENERLEAADRQKALLKLLGKDASGEKDAQDADADSAPNAV
ncbi:MAG: hypothetical protein ACRDXX_10640 [Stackebrandtia sp.]